MLQELKQILIKEAVDNIAIVIFGSPDPDALASAYALAFVLKHCDVKSKIYCEKEISHPNNQMMVNHLDINLHKLSDAKDIKNYAIVDFQFQELANFKDARCIIHLDHHKEIPSTALYQVIDSALGSTSTILTQALQEMEIKNDKLLSKITLGLAYGVYTDTDSLLQATPKDFEALAFLKNSYEADAFSQLINVQYSAQTMEVIRKALEHNQIKGTFAYSGIGYISADYRDSLAIAADFLLSQAGISNVLVFGIVEGQDKDVVNGCFRTSDSAVDVQKFMQSFIVHGSGGGRKSAGGFQEPLGFFEDCKAKEKVWDMVRTVIEEKIKAKVTLTKEEVNGNGKH